jgi:hypothetical protein
MAKRMTIVFDDEELYTALKVEVARSHRPGGVPDEEVMKELGLDRVQNR